MILGHTPIGRDVKRQLTPKLADCATLLRASLRTVILHYQSLRTTLGTLWRQVYWAGQAPSQLSEQLRLMRSGLATIQPSLNRVLAAISSDIWKELIKGARVPLQEIEKFYSELRLQIPSLIHLKISKLTVVDHLGRNIPVPIELCSSIQSLDFIVQCYCRDRAGSPFVERGDYQLIRSCDNKILEGRRFLAMAKCETVFEMSIILRLNNSVSASRHVCPRCSHTNSTAIEYKGWIECARCSGNFSVEDASDRKPAGNALGDSLWGQEVPDDSYYHRFDDDACSEASTFVGPTPGTQDTPLSEPQILTSVGAMGDYFSRRETSLFRRISVLCRDVQLRWREFASGLNKLKPFTIATRADFTRIIDLVFSPDGQFLSALTKGSSRVFRVARGPGGLVSTDWIHTYNDVHDIQQMEWSSDGKLLVRAKNTTSIMTMDGVCVYRFTHHGRGPVAWLSNSVFLTVDGSKIFRHVINKPAEIVYSFGNRRPLALKAVPDGAHGARLIICTTRSGLASESCYDNRLLVYNMQKRIFEHQVWLRDEICSVKFSQSLTQILITFRDFPCQVWNVSATNGKLELLSHLEGLVKCGCFAGDKDELVISIGPDNCVDIWESQSGALVHRIPGSCSAPATLSSIAWSGRTAHDYMFADGSNNGVLRLWTARPHISAILRLHTPVPYLKADSLKPSDASRVQPRSANTPKAMDSYEHSLKFEQHYEGFSRYIPHEAKVRGEVRMTARHKLTKLTEPQLFELSTDVYDEMNRRLDLEAGCLLNRPDYHPKRNEARQKLSTLRTARFLDLVSDAMYELSRRFPHLRVKVQDKTVYTPLRSSEPQRRGSFDFTELTDRRSHT
ncbi:hypothetical protein HGRIS_011503 [Hohenbuehelia grisea]